MLTLALIGIAAYLFYQLQLLVYKKWWNRSLFVTIGFRETAIFEGDEGELQEVIENRKKLPLPMLKVKFQTDRNLVFDGTRLTQATDQFYRNDVFHVGSSEKITRTLKFTGTKRGYYRINRIETLTSDLFLATTMMESKGTDRFVYVYPKPCRNEDFRQSLQQINGEMPVKRRFLEDPFEFSGIRPYQPYDELRHINWKATARTMELKVNRKNHTSLRTVRVFFNTEDTGIRKKPQAVEASLQIVAGLAEFYLLQGMQVACYGNGRDIVTGESAQIEAGSGSDHMERIYKILARLDTNRPAGDFRQQLGQKLLTEDKDVITFIVAPNAYDDFTALVSEYHDTGGDFVWYYPSADKKFPKIPESIRQSIRIVPALN